MAAGFLPVGSSSSQRDVDRADEALSQSLLPDGFQVHPAGDEGVDDLRVPLGAAAVAEIVVDLRGREPLAVRTVTRHGVERVGHRENSRLQRNLLAREVIGVSRSVQALVVMPDAGKMWRSFLRSRRMVTPISTWA